MLWPTCGAVVKANGGEWGIGIAAVEPLELAIELPREALTGGLVTAPTLAVVGEAGPEVVLPLSSLQSGYDSGIKPGVGTALSALSSMTSPADRSSGRPPIVLQAPMTLNGIDMSKSSAVQTMMDSSLARAVETLTQLMEQRTAAA